MGLLAWHMAALHANWDGRAFAFLFCISLLWSADKIYSWHSPKFLSEILLRLSLSLAIINKQHSVYYIFTNARVQEASRERDIKCVGGFLYLGLNEGPHNTEETGCSSVPNDICFTVQLFNSSESEAGISGNFQIFWNQGPDNRFCRSEIRVCFIHASLASTIIHTFYLINLFSANHMFTSAGKLHIFIV